MNKENLLLSEDIQAHFNIQSSFLSQVVKSLINCGYTFEKGYRRRRVFNQQDFELLKRYMAIYSQKKYSREQVAEMVLKKAPSEFEKRLEQGEVGEQLFIEYCSNNNRIVNDYRLDPVWQKEKRGDFEVNGRTYEVKTLTDSWKNYLLTENELLNSQADFFAFVFVDKKQIHFILVNVLKLYFDANKGALESFPSISNNEKVFKFVKEELIKKKLVQIGHI